MKANMRLATYTGMTKRNMAPYLPDVLAIRAEIGAPTTYATDPEVVTNQIAPAHQSSGRSSPTNEVVVGLTIATPILLKE